MNLLEDHLEVRLFHRSHKGLSLTEAGEAFYTDAKHIIKYSDNTLKRIKEISRGVSDIIRIGSSPITPVDYLLNIGPALQQEGIRFQIIPFENNPENAHQILDNLGKDIDIVLQQPFSFETAIVHTLEEMPPFFFKEQLLIHKIVKKQMRPPISSTTYLC